jgi:hypothetical protein
MSSRQFQKAVERAARCSRKRACCSSGTGSSPSGTRCSATSRITIVSTASRPVPCTSIAIRAGSMHAGAAAMTPCRQTRYGRWTSSPVTRMSQSVAGLSRLTKYRSPSTTTRSKSAPVRASPGRTSRREVARASRSWTLVTASPRPRQAADQSTAIAPTEPTTAVP